MIRAALIAAVFAAPLAAAPAPPRPGAGCTDAAHHAFDFWIGRWDVVQTRGGKPAGSSLIEPLYSGCAIRENWSDPSGFSGGSLNTFDARTGKWRQTWTDSANSWREFVGGLEDGKMVLVARRTARDDPSRTLTERMTFTHNADGSVRQYSDQSTDEGKTWSIRYDFTYRRARWRSALSFPFALGAPLDPGVVAGDPRCPFLGLAFLVEAAAFRPKPLELNRCDRHDD